MDFFAALGLVAVLFMLFRQIERWLHQHIFKVGWLLTRNFQTTTILYYTFFLPGVVLHEVIYWLIAGVLDVRAEGAIKWPEKQEIGELKLNFIKLANRAGRIKTAIIGAAPVVIGMVIIWYIASQIFNISATFGIMNSGDLADITAGIGQLTTTPDFWLWFYLAFVIGNTMIPSNTAQLRGWWIVGTVVAVIFLILLVIGIGSQIFSTVSVPLIDALNILSGILAILISINAFMTLVLGTIEAIVERTTGRSATFRNGKMIVMSREEVRTQREQERRRTRQRPSRKETVAGPPTIYRFPLPIPDVPGKEPVTRAPAAIVEPPRPEAIPASASVRAGASVIEGGKVAAADSETTEKSATRPPFALPGGRTSTPAIRQPSLRPSASYDDSTPSTSDQTEMQRPVASRPTALPSSPFASRPTAPSSDTEQTAKDRAPSSTSFRPGAASGQPPLRSSPFPTRSAGDKNDEDDDGEDDDEKPTSDIRSRLGGLSPRPSPFSARPDDDDDDFEDDDEYDEDEDDFDDDDIDAGARLGAFSQRPSPSTSRPFTPPGSSFLSSRLQGSKAKDDEDDDDIAYEDEEDSP